jgi:hypothetical protein
MEFEEALKILDPAFYQETGKHLNDVELAILEGTWKNHTYQQIADDKGYSKDYLKNDVGQKLWKILSKIFQEEVKKNNLHSVLLRLKQNLAMDNQAYPLVKIIEFPEGVVPLDSPFYIERLPIESDCYEEIEQPGALIRIKAPKQIGKTSLLNRILHHAEQQGYRTVRFNLQKMDGEVFKSLDHFLRFLCIDMSDHLQITEQLDQYWNRGSKVSCSNYLKFLLEEIDIPLVLGFDEIDRIFDYPEIYQDFFSLLRSWYEDAKDLEIFENLRLLVVHSTEDYGRLDINQSPFNIGFPVNLSEFTLEQMIDLAKCHQLHIKVDSPEINLLYDMIGGHPYLARLAFYHLARHSLSFDQLLEDAATPAGIYDNHLRRHLEALQQKPELSEAFKQVINADQPIQIEPMQAYKLHSMGLIKKQGYLAQSRCDLYYKYFQQYL